MENLNSSLLEPIITPRFALSCSEGLMTKLGDLAKSNNLAIQTHISENRGEMQIVKDLFPRCKDYLEVYENHNLIGNRTLLAHGIHLSDDELSRIHGRPLTRRLFHVWNLPLNLTTLVSFLCF